MCSLFYYYKIYPKTFLQNLTKSLKMADNLITIDPWIRSTFSDAWLSEAFTRDNEIITKALEKSLSDNNQSGYDFENLLYSPEIQIPIGVQTPTPTVSGGGSEAETVALKGKSTAAIGINGGKITKRKRRKSKRSTTIFISADPVNFRRMVQQVTGPKLEGNLQLPFFIPEPDRRLDSNHPMQQQNSSYLPTFDTSAFLLEHPNQQQHVVAASGSVGQPSSLSVGGSNGLPEVVHGRGGGGGSDFGSLCSFPTLDSWNVM